MDLEELSWRFEGERFEGVVVVVWIGGGRLSFDGGSEVAILTADLDEGGYGGRDWGFGDEWMTNRGSMKDGCVVSGGETVVDEGIYGDVRRRLGGT